MGHGGSQPGLQTFREDVMLCVRCRGCHTLHAVPSPDDVMLSVRYRSVTFQSAAETKVESGTSQSKSGTSLNLSKGGLRARPYQTPEAESAFDGQALFCLDLETCDFLLFVLRTLACSGLSMPSGDTVGQT